MPNRARCKAGSIVSWASSLTPPTCLSRGAGRALEDPQVFPFGARASLASGEVRGRERALLGLAGDEESNESRLLIGKPSAPQGELGFLLRSELARQEGRSSFSDGSPNAPFGRPAHPASLPAANGCAGDPKLFSRPQARCSQRACGFSCDIPRQTHSSHFSIRTLPSQRRRSAEVGGKCLTRYVVVDPNPAFVPFTLSG